MVACTQGWRILVVSLDPFLEEPAICASRLDVPERGQEVVDVAFRDDGQCSFLSNAAVYGDFSKEAEIQGRILQHSDDTRRFEMSRIPYDLHGKQREIRDERFGVLHFGYAHEDANILHVTRHGSYVNWSDAMDKIVLQRMLLRISHPEIPPHVLNKILMDVRQFGSIAIPGLRGLQVFDEAGVHGVLAPSGILGSWGKFGVDVEQAFGINDENFAYAQVWSEPDDRLEVDKTPGAQVSYNQTARAYCLSLIENDMLLCGFECLVYPDGSILPSSISQKRKRVDYAGEDDDDDDGDREDGGGGDGGG
eukprot:393597-Hanusia_phi.AAC.1